MTKMPETTSHVIPVAMQSESPLHHGQEPSRHAREARLAQYIARARDQLTVLDIQWYENRWPGIATFTKFANGKRGLSLKQLDSSLLDSEFINFAKAYIREQFSLNPQQTRTNTEHRLRTLRLIEVSLLDIKRSANPIFVDIMVLDAAAELARKSFTGATPYYVGQFIEQFGRFIAKQGFVPSVVGQWRSPIDFQRYTGRVVGSSGDKHRAKKLPNFTAVAALAEVFSRKLDPTDERCHRDIYTTGVATLLCSAPSRGQEVHRLPVNLIFQATDSFGDEQLGLRWEGSKGYGSFIKWVWSDMVPAAHTAIDRIKAITEEARRLARHYENPETSGLFYRHNDCPDVAEDEPLTPEQTCQALGFSLKYARSSLLSAKLSSRLYTHSLATLWNDWVLPRHRANFPDFPFVGPSELNKPEAARLKFSEALFCMRAHQLHTLMNTSPVMLWIPTLGASWYPDVNLSSQTNTNIFDRYGYKDEDGAPLALKSHQLRHLLNTEAQRGEMTDVLIAAWSGRANITHNQDYDNRPAQEVVDSLRPVVEAQERVLTVVGTESSDSHVRQSGPWIVQTFTPPQALENQKLHDIQPQLTGLKTEYGQCVHDWAVTPCEGFVECLECSDHRCITGGDPQESKLRLQRIETLHEIVQGEVLKAQTSQAAGDWGAEEWLKVQIRYQEKLAQLISVLRQLIDDGQAAVIRMANTPAPSHLHRAMRAIAVRARQDNLETEKVIQIMLDAVNERAEPNGIPITVHRRSVVALPPSAGDAHSKLEE